LEPANARGILRVAFPLPATLSRAEQEKRSPRLGKSINGFCSMAIDFFESSQRLFPLPEGEGQGEGKRSGFASSFPFASPTIFQGTA